LLHNQVSTVGALAQVLQHHAGLSLHLFVRAAQKLDKRRHSIELSEALFVGRHYRQIAQGTTGLLLHTGVARR
jgi:hypothetical protein